MQKLQQIQEYIDLNGKRPKQTDKNAYIKKMGWFLSRQKENYKKQKDIMKDDNIRKIWEDFVEKNKKHFPK